jgi:hypothetical protein
MPDFARIAGVVSSRLSQFAPFPKFKNESMAVDVGQAVVRAGREYPDELTWQLEQRRV